MSSETDQIDWRAGRTADGWVLQVYRSNDCSRWFGEVRAVEPDDLTSAFLQVGTEEEARRFCVAALAFLRAERVKAPSRRITP